MRPDGSSAISVMGGETMTAELAHEIMGLQVYLSFYQPVSIWINHFPTLLGSDEEAV